MHFLIHAAKSRAFPQQYALCVIMLFFIHKYLRFTKRMC